MEWKWQYNGHFKDPTIILEAFVSNDLCIWHSFIGLPSSHNDLNVLSRSPLFSKLVVGDASPCNYEVNGHQYTMCYYLADGIYPLRGTIVKTILRPMTHKTF
jgi:hypothetical protein